MSQLLTLFSGGKTLYDYAVFVDDFTTDLAAGSVNGTYSSDGRAKRVVVDTENKLSISGGALVISGGKAAPGWGDPAIWYTDAADTAFSVGAGHALLVTWRVSTADTQFIFGFDADTDGLPIEPRILTQAGAGDGTYGIQDAAGYKGLGSIALNTEITHLLVQRSDTHGYQWLEHVSGKQWRRMWVDESAEIGGGSVYPEIASNNAAATISRIALLDLSPLMPGDFSEVTDTKTNPASGTTFDCDSTYHLHVEWTHEDTKYINWQTRYQDSDNMVWGYFDTSGNIHVYKKVATVDTELFSANTGLVDTTAYKLDVVDDGDLYSVFLDNVLIDSSTDQTNVGNDGGAIAHNLATNDIVLTTHPYPALGGSVLGATSRVVCPQTSDAGTMDANAYVVIRGAFDPGGGNAPQLELRKSGSYETRVYIDAGGDLYLFEDADVRIYDAAAVTDGDDVQIVLNGDAAEEFVNGASSGTYSGLTTTTGTGWRQLHMGDGNDSTEFWPLYPMLPFKL